MWTKEQIKTLVSTPKFAVAVASAVSLATGSVGGYFLAKTQLEKKYAAIADKEIEDAKAFYAQRNKEGDYADPSVLAAKYDEVEEYVVDDAFDEEIRESAKALLKDLAYRAAEEGHPEEEVSVTEKVEVKASIRQNIFDNPDKVEEEDDDFDLEAEKENRSPDRPYVIHVDEFLENETEYSQNSISYFEGDEVLVDEMDQPIRDIQGVVGVENLSFGYGSRDKNVVYIRNDRLEIDFEVTRSEGKYTTEVLGFIEHSDKPRPRKFRHDD